MKGVCTRWAVVRKADLEPIEGTLYAEQSKANKRRAGSHDPEQFLVVEVAVMPVEIARRMIEALPK